ncbi:MAG: cyclase family protein [Defluviitaleaceae bacterium]|nr:cyclase family protein [Defluviitaleaceae bacterium]
MKIHDITASISNNLPPYGGGLRPVITHPARMADGEAYNISKMSFSSHTGTHADTPFHFIADGADCITTPLDHFYGPCKVVTLPVTSHITKADIEGLDIQAGDIILFNTGQSKYMSCGDFKEDFIALTPEAAEYLVSKKIKTIGIDYLSLDPYGAEGFPAHKLLLGSGIAALEGLVLDGVPDGEYILSALPLKYPGGDGSPVRAILIEQ